MFDLKKTHEQKVVILRFAPEVLEDAMLPIPLHLIPVLNLTVPDGVADRVSFRVCEGLVANVKIQVVNASLGSEVAT